MISVQKLEICYFHLFAKVAPIFALEHSGLDYIYKKPENWAELKPTLTWGCLPCLKNLPEAHGGGELGQEAAILNYIASAAEGNKMKGEDLSEYVISQQLLGEGEDIYQGLGKIKNKLISNEAALAFWNKDNKDMMSPNGKFLYVVLQLIENFNIKCGKSKEGKFTTSGCTVGECKLWCSLHSLTLIEPTVLDEYTGLKAFYKRFQEETATQNILNGSKTGGVLPQYHTKPEGM